MNPLFPTLPTVSTKIQNTHRLKQMSSFIHTMSNRRHQRQEMRHNVAEWYRWLIFYTACRRPTFLLRPSKAATALHDSSYPFKSRPWALTDLWAFFTLTHEMSWSLFGTVCKDSGIALNRSRVLCDWWKVKQKGSRRMASQDSNVVRKCVGCRTRDGYPLLEWCNRTIRDKALPYNLSQGFKVQRLETLKLSLGLNLRP